jgi:hypothetical protein
MRAVDERPVCWSDPMNRGGRVITLLQRLVSLFAPRCSDRRTMDELAQLLADDAPWTAAQDLLGRIHAKALLADRHQDRMLSVQYSFEGICARTLCTLSQLDLLDSDSAYWIVPNAFALGRALGLDDARVQEIVSG